MPLLRLHPRDATAEGRLLVQLVLHSVVAERGLFKSRLLAELRQLLLLELCDQVRQVVWRLL